jgi:hypothetical protein
MIRARNSTPSKIMASSSSLPAIAGRPLAFLTLLLVAMFFSGCGRTSDVQAPAAPAPAPKVSVGDIAAQAPSEATPPPTPAPATVVADAPAAGSPADAPAAAGSGAAGASNLAEDQIVEQLQGALQQYYLANAASPARFTAPKTLEELVSKGFLKKIPAAPPGKRIVYRPENWQVLIERAK